MKLISVRFLGARVYARFRICDDSPRNLTILATERKPGKAAYTRRFTTRIAPNPCGVYTRSWVPVARLRGKGRYTVTIAVRDTSGRTSAPVRRTFTLRSVSYTHLRAVDAAVVVVGRPETAEHERGTADRPAVGVGDLLRVG